MKSVTFDLKLTNRYTTPNKIYFSGDHIIFINFYMKPALHLFLNILSARPLNLAIKFIYYEEYNTIWTNLLCALLKLQT